MTDPQRLLFVANGGPGHVGRYFVEAAASLGCEARLCDVRDLQGGSAVVRWANWRLRDHRPTGMRRFSERVVSAIEEFEPQVLLTTGVAPIERAVLDRARALDVRSVNFSTDDPWNVAHCTKWFLAELPSYDTIYTPRSANMGDFAAAGCRDVRYLPFAFSPSVHRAFVDDMEPGRLTCDAIFIGNADPDRIALMSNLAAAGIRLDLYGGYWERSPITRPFARGFIEPNAIPRAVALAKVAPCLVRRSNRDGHSMRTFELAAMGACMCLEDTDDHRAIFRDTREHVPYFRTDNELVDTVRTLLGDNDRRSAVRESLVASMNSQHTYQARLKSIIDA